MTVVPPEGIAFYCDWGCGDLVDHPSLIEPPDGLTPVQYVTVIHKALAHRPRVLAEHLERHGGEPDCGLCDEAVLAVPRPL